VVQPILEQDSVKTWEQNPRLAFTPANQDTKEQAVEPATVTQPVDDLNSSLHITSLPVPFPSSLQDIGIQRDFSWHTVQFIDEDNKAHKCPPKLQVRNLKPLYD
jgi:hypothetical protein